MTPTEYLQQQGRLVRKHEELRTAMADRLGITVAQLRALTEASALRPGVTWRLGEAGR